MFRLCHLLCASRFALALAKIFSVAFRKETLYFRENFDFSKLDNVATVTRQREFSRGLHTCHNISDRFILSVLVSNMKLRRVMTPSGEAEVPSSGERLSSKCKAAG